MLASISIFSGRCCCPQFLLCTKLCRIWYDGNCCSIFCIYRLWSSNPLNSTERERDPSFGRGLLYIFAVRCKYIFSAGPIWLEISYIYKETLVGYISFASFLLDWSVSSASRLSADAQMKLAYGSDRCRPSYTRTDAMCTSILLIAIYIYTRWTSFLSRTRSCLDGHAL